MAGMKRKENEMKVGQMRAFQDESSDKQKEAGEN